MENSVGFAIRTTDNDHCLKTIIKYWDVPLQHAYLENVVASGHGGFVHSCFLGAYWGSPPYPNPVLAGNFTSNQKNLDRTFFSEIDCV